MVIRVYISSSSYVTDIDALFPRPSPLTARMRHAVSTPRRASAAVHTVSLFPLFVSLLCLMFKLLFVNVYRRLIVRVMHEIKRARRYIIISKKGVENAR